MTGELLLHKRVSGGFSPPLPTTPRNEDGAGSRVRVRTGRFTPLGTFTPHGVHRRMNQHLMQKKVLSHFQGWRLSPRFATDPGRG